MSRRQLLQGHIDVTDPGRSEPTPCTVHPDIIAATTELVYNRAITLSGIPAWAYRYQLGSRSAVEWILERTRSRPTRPPESSTTPTTGAARSATRATSSTCWLGPSP
ncbi:hypothetical protein BN11_5020005 [Nostocoides australiense Ben110]|uniref:Type ISP restriction-modification enzyme LLaBIII C-terminal specificity domain-containing protein n=1 Tax=Nostocoides australiense Ben110 TaxID=1193182 RepID=W6K1W6_9MICO|nr:hypothetical protein BN11_5020005 [Tetrasphaera australiensis Ben110]